jgi:hypothetical protein
MSEENKNASNLLPNKNLSIHFDLDANYISKYADEKT